MDVDTEISLFRKCEQYGLTDSRQMYYPLFSLDSWAQLYAKAPWFTTKAIFCFDFQKAVIDQINRQNEPIHVLPGSLLDELMDAIQAAKQGAPCSCQPTPPLVQ